MELSLQALPEESSAGVIDVADGVFGRDFNESLIHQSVVAYMAHARSGTKAQKNRSDVAGSTAKPWRQKGTGRARAGTTRSPIWRSGGVTFAARPRNFSQKLNKKMYRAALCSILSELIRQERLVAVEDFAINTPKTREVVAKIKPFDQAKTLIITAEEDSNLGFAARNLFYVAVETAQSINPLSLVWADKVVITSSALKQIEERLA